jgi:hypothetical protein
MSDREASELALKALALAVGDRSAEAATILHRLLQDGDVQRVYGLCCGFAEGGRKALLKRAGGRAPIFANGESWGIQELRPGQDDPAAAFSVRFLVAHANGERDTARAHYVALLKAGDECTRVRAVARLFSDIAALCRDVTEPGGGGG